MLIVLYNFIVAYRKIFIYIRATVDIAFRAMHNGHNMMMRTSQLVSSTDYQP